MLKILYRVPYKMSLVTSSLKHWLVVMGLWWWWWRWWWIVFVVWLSDGGRGLVSGRGHCCGSLPSRAGFGPVRGLGSGFGGWSYAVVMATEPRLLGFKLLNWVLQEISLGFGFLGWVVDTFTICEATCIYHVRK